MFMKTIAVGPLDDVASWVTGGTTVAIDRFWHCASFEIACRVLTAANFGKEDGEKCLQSWDTGDRTAIICKICGKGSEGIRKRRKTQNVRFGGAFVCLGRTSTRF